MQAPQAGEPDMEFGIGESRISQIGERTIERRGRTWEGEICRDCMKLIIFVPSCRILMPR